MDKDTYLLELSRYVVLNPVRAGIVKRPSQWAWSSYHAMVGAQNPPKWLMVDALLAQFGRNRGVAHQRYERFVAEGIGAESVWRNLRGQIYLGDERFVESMQSKLDSESQDVNIPRAQRRKPAPPLARIEREHKDRNRAVLAAHETGEYSYQQIAEHFGIHFTTAGRIVRAGRKSKRKTEGGRTR